MKQVDWNEIVDGAYRCDDCGRVTRGAGGPYHKLCRSCQEDTAWYELDREEWLARRDAS